MKKYIKLAMAGLFMVSLYSCQKNDIEVLRNNDVSWKPDEIITNADIRTRIGYDPRFDYIFTENTLIDIPMYCLGDFQITGKKEMQVKVQLAQPVDRNVTVSLKYDTNLFEKVRSSYGEYKLAKEDFVTLDATQKEITKGETSATFTISVNNDATLKDKLLLPYSLVAINDEKVKVVDTYDTVLLKIFPQEIAFEYPHRLELNMVADANDLFTSANTLTIGVSQVVNDDITLSLVKDEKGTSDLPAGALETLPTDIDFKGITSKEFTLTINNASLVAGRNYRLPLKVVLKQGAKVYEQPITIDLNFSGIRPSENVALGSKKIGTKVAKKDIKASFSTSMSSAGAENDGNYTNYTYAQQKSIKMDVAFTSREVKSFVISLYGNYTLSSTSVFAVDAFGKEVSLGKVTFPTTTENKEYIISFKNPVKTNKLIFKDITSSGQYIVLSEIDVYE